MDDVDTGRLVRILEVAVGVLLQVMTEMIKVVGHQLVGLPYSTERRREVRIVQRFWFGSWPNRSATGSRPTPKERSRNTWNGE